MDKTSCLNCGKELIGSYCHHCGQKKDVTRLSWGSLLNDLQKRLFGFDNNYFRTVRDLTIAPGKVIQSTIDGVRVRYIGPVGYYFLMITIFVLLLSFLDIDMAEYTKDIVSTFSVEDRSQSQQEMQMKINSFVFSNFRLISFLMIPFFVLGVWIIFKNKKLNFLESSVVVFYSQGHPVLLSIFGLLGYKFFNMIHAQLYIAPLSYLYFAFSCASFYKGSKIWNFFKGIIAMALGFVILMLISMLVGIIVAFISPELFKGAATT